MLKRIFRALAVAVALSAALYGIWRVADMVYIAYRFPGPVNSSGDQPPTACTVQTVAHDCRKLNCVSRVWYCDERGSPTCIQNRCVCWYGCL